MPATNSGLNLIIAQKSPVTRLDEVPVICKGFPYASLFHYQKTRTIGQTPLLVGPFGVMPDRSCETLTRLRHRLDSRIVPDSCHCSNGQTSVVFAKF